METILSYLDTMFQNVAMTPEVKKAKQELAQMMEDKYNELIADGKNKNEAVGTVISEFGNLDDLAEKLGISNMVSMADNGVMFVSREQVDEYLDVSIRSASKIAIGVFLCIISPIMLIVLSGLADAKVLFTENVAAAIGLPILFLLVAIAVALFILNGMKMDQYKFLSKEFFELDESTIQFIMQEQKNFQPEFAIRITVGVILCILSVVPILVTSTLFEDKTVLGCSAIAFLLIVVACAVVLFINAGIRHSTYQILLQEGEYSKREKEGTLTGTVSSIYWPVIVCIFLAYSFVTNRWDISWIIWPVAGCLFAVIAVICNVIEKSRD